MLIVNTNSTTNTVQNITYNVFGYKNGRLRVRNEEMLAKSDAFELKMYEEEEFQLAEDHDGHIHANLPLLHP